MSEFFRAGRKLSIWHIAETYPPDYGGGATMYLREACRLMAERGHDVRVLCTEKVDADPYTVQGDRDGPVRVDRVNLPYFRTKDPDGWRMGLLRWRAHQRRVARVLDTCLSAWEPDLVQYHTCRPFGEECLGTVRRHGIPIVGLLHDAWLICPRITLLRSPKRELCAGPTPIRCLECMYSYYDGGHGVALLKLPWRLLKLGVYPAYRLWRRRSASQQLVGAVTYSRFIAGVHNGPMRGHVRYLPWGIDLSGLPAVPPPRPRSPLRFGFVGGFQQIKGIWHVLDAAVALKARALSFELHIWGPRQEIGPQEVAIRGLEDRVFLRGMYTPGQRWHVYGEMDVAIMATTVCEALGRVPMEAAATGAPTIAPAVGGIPETIDDGETGLLYRFGDTKDLERQMERVLKDPVLLSRLMKGVRKPQSVEKTGPALEAFYFEILASSRTVG